MNLRKSMYFGLVALRGQPLGAYYERFWRESQAGIPLDTTKQLLIKLLSHCEKSVPYYAEIMKARGDSFKEDPEEYLHSFPVLTKDIIRCNFEALKSADLPKRKWYFNTSGGSTGEPARFIQDYDYAARSGALKLLYSRLAAGQEIGESEIRLWSSPRDMNRSSKSQMAQLVNKLANIHILSAFRLDPETIRQHINTLNKRKPKLMVAYTSSMYEIAKFAELNNLNVVPQNAIIVTAGTLYPYMRETIERVFQCPVYTRYGSREVGDVACERPGRDGLWVAPWGNYVEIVDANGNRVRDGVPGEILLTSLSNYAMPLIRYQIGDRGALSPPEANSGNEYGQVLSQILGRTIEVFVNTKGSIVEAGYFMPLLYFRDWISRYQVIQKSPSSVLFKIVSSGSEIPSEELDEIASKTKLIMNDDKCEAHFEFVDEIPASDSGKFRFLVSDIRVD